MTQLFNATAKVCDNMDNKHMPRSGFGFDIDIVQDFADGDCFLLAYSLFKIIKQHNERCSVVITSDDNKSFIHAVVEYKQFYVDVLGFHTYDEMCDYHKDTFGTEEYIYVDKVKNLNSYVDWLYDTYSSREFSYAMRYAEEIYKKISCIS